MPSLPFNIDPATADKIRAGSNQPSRAEQALTGGGVTIPAAGTPVIPSGGVPPGQRAPTDIPAAPVNQPSTGGDPTTGLGGLDLGDFVNIPGRDEVDRINEGFGLPGQSGFFGGTSQAGPFDVAGQLSGQDFLGAVFSDQFDPTRNPINARNLEMARVLLPLIQQLNPTLPLDVGAKSFQQNQPTDLLSALGGLFQHSSGLNESEGGAPLETALNLRFSQFLEGAGRGQERERLQRQQVTQAAGAPAARGGLTLGLAAGDLADPNILNDRFDALRRQTQELNASGLANTRNRLADLGITSQGGGQAPAIIGAEAGAQRSLADQLTQLEQFKAQEQRANLQAAGQGLSTSGQLFEQFNINPTLRLIGALQGPQNLGTEPFANQLERAAQISQGLAVSQQDQSQLPGLLSLGGGILGGIIGGPGGFAVGSAGGNQLGTVLG